jgi:hypothetical protein
MGRVTITPDRRLEVSSRPRTESEDWRCDDAPQWRPVLLPRAVEGRPGDALRRWHKESLRQG